MLHSVPTPLQKPGKQRPSQSQSKQRIGQTETGRRNSSGDRPSLRAVSAPVSRVGTVKRFPAKRAMPLWLQFLLQMQRGSLVIAFILVATTLVVYGSTVYTQQLWSKDYRKLKTLTRNEREMIATNEGLKNQLALQAERPGSGLVPQTTDSMIFLQPALQRQAANAMQNVPKATVAPNTPLGY